MIGTLHSYSTYFACIDCIIYTFQFYSLSCQNAGYIAVLDLNLENTEFLQQHPVASFATFFPYMLPRRETQLTQIKPANSIGKPKNAKNFTS